MANQQQYWQFEIFGTDPDLIGFYGPAGIILPSGNTGERPASPALGHMRFNTQINSFEGFDGSWVPFETGLVPTFDALADTPPSKIGSANRVMIVNSAETLIEFSTALTLENSGRLRVPAAYEALIDADTVITNRKYVNDQDILQLSLSGGLMTGGITMGSNSITGLPLAPTTASEATSKSYVDGLFAGIDRKESAHLTTTADLNTETGNSWVAAGAKVGKTLTSDANTATIDGVAVVDGYRVLVRNQTNPIDNGIYDVSGVGGAAVVFTRSEDTDGSPANEVNGGATTFVVLGSTLALTQWTVVATGNVDVDVDAMNWTITGAIAGAFLELAGGTMVGSITMGAAGIQVIGDTSSASAPTYSFDSDLGTGLHQINGAGTMSLLVATASIWNISATALIPAVNVTQDIGSSGLKVKNIYADHHLPNFGAVGDPSYAFEGDATTGMYNDGAGGIGFAVGGNDALSVESDGTVSVDTASYETLVLANNDVPNKKYVDDSIGAVVSISDTDGDTSVNVETAADDDTIRFNTGETPAGFPANTNTMTLASSGLSVALPAPDVATTVGAPISLTAGAGNTTGAGGAVGIVGGASGATGGDGGVITITGGASTVDDGGDVNILGGDTTGTGNAKYGGAVNITGGTNTYSTGDSYGGPVNITGGTGDNYGGAVNITGGVAADAAGESYGVNINGGEGGAYAGPISIRGGDGASGRDPGNVQIYGGRTGPGGTSPAGDVGIYGGAGYVTHKGGDLTLLAGSGVAGGGTGAGGATMIRGGRGGTGSVGGLVEITGGRGGEGSVAGVVNITGGYTSVNGGGGDIVITSGAGGATTGDAGDIVLTPGAAAGAGSAGAINITPSTAPAVTTDKLYNITGALTWNGIDLTAANQYTEAFDNSDLAGGILTVTHSLGRRYNHVTVYDNGAIIVQPDSVTATSTSVTTIDLNSFGALTGTWNVVVS